MSASSRAAIAVVALLSQSPASQPSRPNIPPDVRGCLRDVASGDRTVTCGGLRVDVRVPASCPANGCGLILDLHGDTGTGLLEDAHTQLRERGSKAGFVVVDPTGPSFGGGGVGSTWSPANDATLVAIVEEFADVLHVDRARVHVTGFSRGGYTTWRLLCDHADVFASAAPGAAGATAAGPCFANGRLPSRQIPILFLIGRDDAQVVYAATSKIRDAAIAAYNARGPERVSGNTQYIRNRWSGSAGGVVEVIEHSYRNPSAGSWGFARGHCYPGSPVSANAPQYGLPCEGPNAFSWGEEVLRFFQAHPMPPGVVTPFLRSSRP